MAQKWARNVKLKIGRLAGRGRPILVVARGIVGPFVGGPEDEKVGSTWIDRNLYLIS